MAPIQHNNDASTTDSNVQNHESQSLVSKVYSNVLANNTIQSGIKQIVRLSQPLIVKLDDNLLKVFSNLQKLLSNENIYICFANIWLSNTLPFNGEVMTYEAFIEAVKTHQQSGKNHCERAATNFHKFACQAWKALNEPSTEEIRNAMLMIVAKTITKAYNFEDDSLANALCNILRMLIEKRKELISPESFYNLVKISLGHEYFERHHQPIRTACDNFYSFAKRFLLIVFPLVSNDKHVLKLIGNIIHDTTFYYGDYTLNFIEKRLNTLMKFMGKTSEELVDDKTLAEKAQRVMKMVVTLSTFSFKKVEEVLLKVQETKTYAALDGYLHINEKIEIACLITGAAYNKIQENLLEPAWNTVQMITNKAKTKVTFVLHGLDVNLLKKKYTKLHAKYEVLQKCAVMVTDETVKLIFDKPALAELGGKGKKELMRLYHEMKTMEAQKIKAVGMEYYAEILKKAKQTYSTAQKEVYNKKRESGDQEGAKALECSRESETKEVKSSSN